MENELFPNCVIITGLQNSYLCLCHSKAEFLPIANCVTVTGRVNIFLIRFLPNYVNVTGKMNTVDSEYNEMLWT